jgi:hypothetical protein
LWDETTSNITLNGINTADLKIKTTGGDWTDSSIKANVGQEIEFKVTVEISRSYFWLGVLVELPTVDDESMFQYITGSVSPKPILPVGVWRANDEEVAWSWFEVSSGWSKTMTFKATIKKGGSKTINLLVAGDYSSNGQILEDEASDSVDITVDKSRVLNTPAIQLLKNHPVLFHIFQRFQKL